MTSAIETWTPTLAAEAMGEASIWLNQTTRSPYSRGAGSAMPVWTPTLEDWIAEGWGIPDAPTEDETEVLRLSPSAERIAQYEAALNWPSVYLSGWDRDLARAVQAHVASITFKRPFKRVARARGIRLTSANRWRRRGLSVISVGLANDGVPLW